MNYDDRIRSRRVCFTVKCRRRRRRRGYKSEEFLLYGLAARLTLNVIGHRCGLASPLITITAKLHLLHMDLLQMLTDVWMLILYHITNEYLSTERPQPSAIYK